MGRMGPFHYLLLVSSLIALPFMVFAILHWYRPLISSSPSSLGPSELAVFFFIIFSLHAFPGYGLASGNAVKYPVTTQPGLNMLVKSQLPRGHPARVVQRSRCHAQHQLDLAMNTVKS